MGQKSQETEADPVTLAQSEETLRSSRHGLNGLITSTPIFPELHQLPSFPLFPVGW